MRSHWYLCECWRGPQAWVCAILSRRGGDPASPAMVTSLAEPIPSKDHPAYVCPSHSHPPPPTSTLPPWEDREAFPECYRGPSSRTRQGKAFHQWEADTRSHGSTKGHAVSKEASGATAGPNRRSPTPYVHVTPKGRIGEGVFAVVKCSKDTIFYYDAYCRVAVRSRGDRMPVKQLWRLERHRAHAH